MHDLRGDSGGLHERTAEDATGTALPAYARGKVKATRPKGDAQRPTMACAYAEPPAGVRTGDRLARQGRAYGTMRLAKPAVIPGAR